jgi:hypothetical protein
MKHLTFLLAHLNGEAHLHGGDITVIIVALIVLTLLGGVTYALRHDSKG